jgi:membrane fusion protein, heavy metal efflux system
MFTFSSKTFSVVAVICAGFAGALAPAVAHEGHDHEEAAPATENTRTSDNAASADGGRNAVELTSELYEAVLVNRGDHLDIYLDRYDTNEPVPGAKLVLQINDGAEIAAAEAAPAQYTAEITPLAAGQAVNIALSISGAAGEDLLGGTLEVPEETGDSGMRGVLGAVLPWLIGSLALIAIAAIGWRWLNKARPLAAIAVLAAASWAIGPDAATAHEGHDHAEEVAPSSVMTNSGNRPMRLPDGSVFVPKATQRIIELRTQIAQQGPTPVSMRLVGEIVGDPRASASLQTLQGGRVDVANNAWPTLGARVRRGQVLLQLTPTGSGGERASTAAEAARVQAELTQAQAELQRLEGLPGVVSKAELESARARFQGLLAQRRAFQTPLGSGEAIRSPIDGVIAAINVRPGVVVSPGESLVSIIDPARLGVEALAFEPIAGGESSVVRATVATRDGARLEARVEGVGAQLQGGAMPVRLSLTGASAAVVVGQPVVVFLERNLTTPGMGLPAAALVRTSNGDRVVFEKVSAERYVPRTVRVQPVSADTIAVVAGLEPNARIVVNGAALLAQIR